jgi:hypothetical protein
MKFARKARHPAMSFRINTTGHIFGVAFMVSGDVDEKKGERRWARGREKW